MEDNRVIGYDYDSLDDPNGDNNGNPEDHLMKPWKRIGFLKREGGDDDKQLIWLLWIVWFSYYSIFMRLY